MDFLTLAKERYSVRSLSDRPVEPEKIEKILEAGIAAPTAKNGQPFKIWVMESEQARAKAAEATPCAFVKDAPVVFVIGADPEAAWKRPFDGHNFADVDASIVATHMMLEVHDLGLGTCWVGFFDPAKLKGAFPQMEKYELVCLFGVGYPAADAAPSDRHALTRPREELVETL